MSAGCGDQLDGMRNIPIPPGVTRRGIKERRQPRPLIYTDEKDTAALFITWAAMYALQVCVWRPDGETAR